MEIVSFHRKISEVPTVEWVFHSIIFYFTPFHIIFQRQLNVSFCFNNLLDPVYIFNPTVVMGKKAFYGITFLEATLDHL